MTKLRKLSNNEIYSIYVSEVKKDYQNQPSFYLDVADLLIEKKQPQQALRVLSNIAELELENHQLLRILGHRLAQIEELEFAYYAFAEVAKMRPEEPQSFRGFDMREAR